MRKAVISGRCSEKASTLSLSCSQIEMGSGLSLNFFFSLKLWTLAVRAVLCDHA